MTTIGWTTAAILSFPQFHVFHVYHVETGGQFHNMTLCESIWRNRPYIERQVTRTNF